MPLLSQIAIRHTGLEPVKVADRRPVSSLKDQENRKQHYRSLQHIILERRFFFRKRAQRYVLQTERNVAKSARLDISTFGGLGMLTSRSAEQRNTSIRLISFRDNSSGQQEDHMAAAKSELDTMLMNVQELEEFFHAFLPALDEQKLKQGEDVLPYAKTLKLKIPQSLRGEKMTWETTHSHSLAERAEGISLIKPGHPNAVGLTIKCVKIRKWRVCLECGWIWCRIVINRKF